MGPSLILHVDPHLGWNLEVGGQELHPCRWRREQEVEPIGNQGTKPPVHISLSYQTTHKPQI